MNTDSMMHGGDEERKKGGWLLPAQAVWRTRPVFITSTFRGRMTITMGYQDSERAKDGTGRALDLFTRYLLTLADLP